MFFNKLNELGFEVIKVGGMVLDGVLVMLGRNNGVVVKLKVVVFFVIVVYCVCYRFVFVCVDFN